MKINKRILSILYVFINLLIINVNAENIGYYLSNAELNYNYDSAPSEIKVKRGDYIYVTAIINDVSGGNSILKSGNVTVRWNESYLKLVSISDNNYYSLAKSDFNDLEVKEEARTNNRITLSYSSNNTINQGINKLMEFKFRILDNAPTGLTKIYEMDGETGFKCLKGEDLLSCGTSYNSELKYNVESSKINTLSNIKIDGKQIANFNENTKEYTLNFDGTREKINIEVVKKDERESVNGDIGTRFLQYGLNTFNIEVTSESNEKMIYTIKAIREDTRSKDNTLKDIKLSDGIIQFKSDITDYDIDVKNEVSKITIIATLKDAKAKFKEDFSKKEIELKEGINKVMITVIAENGDEKTYVLNITRMLSSNNTLKEITINNEKININKNEFLYYYTVSNETESVNIKAVATDVNATVEVDTIPNLLVGENEIGIRVTAQNGDTVNYTLMVTRERQLSNDAKLSNLEIIGYKLNFDKDTMYYDLKIKDEDSLDIIYETEDEKATVNIEGNKNLIDGSIIKINVQAEDNTFVRYFINIEKEKGNGSLLLIVIISILIIILTIILILLLNKNKKKNNKVSKEKEKIEDETIKDDIKENDETDDEQNEEDNAQVSEDSEEESDVPMVDLDKTIFVKDLNPVIEEKETKKKIDAE